MILDARTKKRAAVWSLDGEIERLAWNPVLEDYFVVSIDIYIKIQPFSFIFISIYIYMGEKV